MSSNYLPTTEDYKKLFRDFGKEKSREFIKCLHTVVEASKLVSYGVDETMDKIKDTNKRDYEIACIAFKQLFGTNVRR